MERVTAWGLLLAQGRPSLSGVVTRLKCDTRKGVEHERKSERWESSRRDEQVSAEKWVSRTGVSAGEYHIATLWRGLRVEGWYARTLVHTLVRSGMSGGRRNATV